MNIAIIGGNYKQLCKEHGCKAKVFTQPLGIKNQIGTPDLLVLFTNTVSHKMVQSVLSSLSNKTAMVVRSHSSSLFALKEILSKHAK